MRSDIEFKSRKHYVYTLTDPFTLKIFYVGCTNDFKRRSRGHRWATQNCGNEKLVNYLNAIVSNNSNPIIKLVKEFNNWESAHKFEILLIQKLSPECNINHVITEVI